jgi:hypothetical protein
MNKRLMGIDPEGLPQRMSMAQALELVRAHTLSPRPPNTLEKALESGAADEDDDVPTAGVRRSRATPVDHS